MIEKDVKEVLVSEEEVIERCKELAAQIEQDYIEKQEVPLVIGLLRGSVPFMAELLKRFHLPVTTEYMKVSSYQGTDSTGDVRIEKDTDLSVKGKSILIVEDIIDTGRTLYEVKKLFLMRGAREVKVVSLLNKPTRREVDIEGDYIGFEIPNKFVVGYGLDYNQKYRNLPFIGVLKPEIYE